jgi:hypothetical protein
MASWTPDFLKKLVYNNPVLRSRAKRAKRPKSLRSPLV